MPEKRRNEKPEIELAVYYRAIYTMILAKQ